ncbi:MAG: hypothetical protein EZS28_030791 [Streblomastix strix]|uniref:ABC transmembrane type-1 domain-containing protein n=1 Tax=Streblomastix strix TaxID=222440 RepID=A0A5J4UTV6_9EUKA|nr:MAG: hypothetical protein EZS28_030791 [Streblomastix strix]
MTEEEYNTGAVPLSSYFSYFLTLFHPIVAVIFMFIEVVSEWWICLLQFWLGIVGSPDQISSITFEYKLLMLGIGNVLGWLFIQIRAIIGAYGVRRSNKIVHGELLNHVIHCPLSFFDTTPLGRILNRFSVDVAQTDHLLYMMLQFVLNLTINMFGQIIIIAISTPLMLAIGIPALILYFVISTLYMRAA